jgi:hypothetical protein
VVRFGHQAAGHLAAAAEYQRGARARVAEDVEEEIGRQLLHYYFLMPDPLLCSAFARPTDRPIDRSSERLIGLCVSVCITMGVCVCVFD